jgi:hypothetical protein
MTAEVECYCYCGPGKVRIYSYYQTDQPGDLKSHMSEINARLTIPPEWGEKINCPICSTHGMSILRQADIPDQLHCQTCGLSFELEKGGNHLYVTHWPVPLFEQAQAAGILWLTMDELRLFAKQAAGKTSTPASGLSISHAQPPASPLKGEIQEEVQHSPEKETHPTAISGRDNRSKPDHPDPEVYIKNLRALGNPYKQIRMILAHSISSPKQLKSALEICGKLERQDQSRQLKKLITSMVLIVLLFVVMGVIWFLFPKQSNDQVLAVSNPDSTSASTLQANSVPTDLPGLVKVLKLATPVVHRYSTLPASAQGSIILCPATKDQAEALFGGEAEYWRSLSGGWIMINPAKAVTINVPNGMKAAYLLLRKTTGMGLAEVQGPATMENVYYVTISCP